jgi:type I restriction enzyme S subunit
LKNGFSGPPSTAPSGIRALTLAAVTQDDFSEKNTKFVHAEAERVADLWLQRGDVFVERANTTEYVGLASLYNGPHGYAIFPDLMTRVRIREDLINPKLVAEFLRSEFGRTYFRRMVSLTSGSMHKVGHSVVRNCPVPVPPSGEQAAIAATINAIDAKVAAESASRLALERLYRSLLEQLLAGNLRIASE